MVSRHAPTQRPIRQGGLGDRGGLKASAHPVKAHEHPIGRAAASADELAFAQPIPLRYGRFQLGLAAEIDFVGVDRLAVHDALGILQRSQAQRGVLHKHAAAVVQFDHIAGVQVRLGAAAKKSAESPRRPPLLCHSSGGRSR